ncbi:MAG TPA: hypothetical protein VI384_00965 [Candidatus Dormibacteraeota bacterium]
MTTPGAVHVKVMTEVGYCPFCQRSRNLRREERQLGGLVRTTIECESCHRTLSSTMAPPAAPAKEEAPAAEPEPEAKPAPKKAAAPKKAVAPKKAAAKKPPTRARKPAATRKPKA